MSGASPRLKLSIVIAAWNGDAALRLCLASLGEASCQTEVIVAANSAIPGALEGQFPQVRFLLQSHTATVPELRSAGVLASSGDIIALTEDHCRFGPHWSEQVVLAHEDPAPAIGGPIENLRVERALDWAVYFYDYGKFMLPIQPGPARELSGANVSYKRAALMAEAECFRGGFFEPVVHGALIARHGGLFLDARPIVHHDKSYRFGEAIRQAYHLARSYAARRVLPSGAARRLVLAAGAPVLFVLLPARVIYGVWKKKRRIKELTRSLPCLLLLTGSWAWGEICGYIGGEGTSGGQWR